MLDAKRTWDDLVTRFALDAEQARRILANHYYQQISSALAGSQEFMAMEKLYELHESGPYDVLVLDTPPTRHALDFLDAPKKMMGFMDEGVLKVFAHAVPHGREAGLGFLKGSTAMMFACSSASPASRCCGTFPTSSAASAACTPASATRRTVEAFLRADGIQLSCSSRARPRGGRGSRVLLPEGDRVPDAVWRVHREPRPPGRARRGTARARRGGACAIIQPGSSSRSA